MIMRLSLIGESDQLIYKIENKNSSLNFELFLWADKRHVQ